MKCYPKRHELALIPRTYPKSMQLATPSKSVPPELPRRAVLYARVSSTEQEHGYSIPAQRELLRHYAKANGMAVEQEFVEAETAKQAGRTRFAAMLAYLKRQPGCRVLLVEKTDRLFRNFQDMAHLEALDVEVHFVKENAIQSNHSRSSDKLMYGLKVLLAKNYCDNLSEEVQKGMRTKAAQGLWPSYAPLGYRNTVSAEQKRIIVPDPALGPTVTALFEWFATGEYSLKTLAQRAYEEGFRFRKSQGRVPATTLQKILRNSIYMGEFDFGGTRYRGIHQPLVSPEVWRQVQEILDGRNKRKHRKGTHDFAYSGVIQCGHCGCSIVGEIKKGKYVYYHCTGYRGKCGEPYTPEAVLQREFVDGLQKLVIPPAVSEWLQAELAECSQNQAVTLEQAITHAQSELVRSQKRLDVLYEDRLDERIDGPTYDRKAEEIREQQGQIRRRIEDAEKKLVERRDETGNMTVLSRDVGKLFGDQTAAEKRKLLRVVIQEASWKGGMLQASLREPFATLATQTPKM
jgi:site-specific DNA recombinase